MKTYILDSVVGGFRPRAFLVSPGTGMGIYALLALDLRRGERRGVGEDGREGEGDLGEAQGASGPKRNPRGRLSCREGWEAEQVSVAEAARERETRRARDRGRGGVLSEGLGEGRGVVGAKGQ